MKTDNEIIAEFMGWTNTGFGNGWEHPNKEMPIWASEIKYDTSWDWLMPVVEKIKQIYNDERGDKPIEPFEMRKLHIFSMGIFMPIDVVYKAVVEFIKWYNSVDKTKTK